MSISRNEEHQLRLAIVREAYEWLSTPYGNCGDIKGIHGLIDCAMLLVRVYATVGVIPIDYDPRPYNSNWHLHQDEARYLAGLEQFAHLTTNPGVGDIAMYRFGRHASHGAIIVSDDLIIHAHKQVGQVSLCERSVLEDKIDSYWTVFGEIH